VLAAGRGRFSYRLQRPFVLGSVPVRETGISPPKKETPRGTSSQPRDSVEFVNEHARTESSCFNRLQSNDMASAARTLTEPRVLAHTKRRLFPDDEGYVVVDTQFSSDRWLANESIDREVKEALAPFNHVRVGSGYPDLVGVRVLGDGLLAVNRLGREPPLVVVEAKGYDGRGGVDAERGIVQAYDRLNEANAAYLAAPAGAVSRSARTLARELNVGVLGVDTDGTVEPLEVPRVVGNRTTTETDAIRFQASAQGVANKSFSLNHPKNYLAYPLAVYHPDETARVLSERVVGAVEGAGPGRRF
jgi:hypothetical protein